MKELPKAYEAKAYETEVYSTWEASGFFNPDNLPAQGEPFSIAMPPPNATGTLHLGHATMLAIQDLVVRFMRLRGRKVLWVPGTDHAAIATQNVVEKKILKEEGKRRHDLGRDQLLQRVNEFVEGSKATIRSQVRAMGASCDWSRERYTLDPGLSSAVREVFVRLYNDKLIYRGKRIVNWCYRCGTTLADDEVEYREEKAKFYYLKYGPIVIGTARPETKVLDKVIIVHPDDARYKQFVGTEFDVAWIDSSVRARVVADPAADMATGTGAMTITPAHSFVDFDLAQKYGFEIVDIIGQDGRLTNNAGKFSGLKVAAARAAIVDELTQKGLVERIDENYVHNLAVCYRCGTAVEPLPSEQWFVAVDKSFRLGWFRKSTLKQLALKAVRSGSIALVPDRFTKVYFHWLENLRDWCISRQIWFGHRIPAWRCPNGHWCVTDDEPMRLTVVRHGLTDWNEEGRIQGTTEVPLDEGEVQRTYAIADELSTKTKYDLIVTSPLVRARQSAAIFAEKLHCPIVPEERIHERNYGSFEGRLVTDIKNDEPNYYRDKLNYPIAGAETYPQMEARLSGWLADVVRRYRGKSVLVVGHTAMMRALKSVLEAPSNEELSNYRPKLEEPFIVNVIGRCRECNSWAMKQDEDTLDTWFSSSLWTFSTLGWPVPTRELAAFHPTSLMETGYDILSFWVARMVLMTSYVLKQVPFHTVYLHGLVRDKQGRKMSKSLGNGIDPVEMIQKYGADALRLSMIIGTAPGNDFGLYEEKIAGYRNFVNKLWNICRFALLSVAEPKMIDVPPSAKTLADRWVLSRLAQVTELVTKKIETYELSEAGEALYDFTWHELADWYLEVAKIEGGKDEILCYILTQILKLWHPYTPFVTEVLWREAFGDAAGMLMVAKWPQQLPPRDTPAEEEFKVIQEVVTAIRAYRVEHKVANDHTLNVAILGPQADAARQHTEIIERLRTKVKFVEQVQVADEIKVGGVTLQFNSH